MDRDVVEAAERLRRLSSTVQGADLLPRNYLVPITQDRRMAGGTVVPALAAAYGSRASGLLVPQYMAGGPQPIDQVQVYLVAGEVLGRSVSRDEVIDGLANVSLEVAVPWIALWLARLHTPSVDRSAVDLLYVDTHVAEPYAAKVRNLLRSDRAVLVAPQGLLCLLKLALLVCLSRGRPEPEVEREEASRLPFALLGLMEHLGSELAGLDEKVIGVVTKVPGAFGRETIANQLANSTRQAAGRWAAFESVWRELPKELASHPRVFDLEAKYQEVTGVALDDLVTVCGALWATTANGNPHMQPDYFAELPWGQARLQAVLDLICASPEAMAKSVYGDMEKYGFPWSVRTFEQFPVVRWPTGHLTVIDPQLLVERATGVWPLYDMLRILQDQGRRRELKRVRGCYDHVVEAYTLRAVGSITGGDQRGRVYNDGHLRRAFGTHGQIADIAIDYGHAWVVMDATTTGLQALTFAGVSDTSVAQDIDKLLEKAKQIDATIRHLRDREAQLTGTRYAGPRRFYPAVVTSSRFATGPIFMSLLRERLAEEGVLQSPDIAALEVLEFEDLDVVEGLAESGGPTLLDVLAGKEHSPLTGMPVRDYILLGLGQTDVPRPARVDARWPAWLATAAKAWSPAA